MNLTIEEVERIAHLARLHLSEDEKTLFQKQLSSILEHIVKLQDIDTSKIDAQTSMSTESSRLRADEPGECLTPDALLKNAPEVKTQQFRVPPVFDNQPK